MTTANQYVNSIEQEHHCLVKHLCKPGAEILASLDADKTHLLHMASKLCSEAGELMDAIGKMCFYNQELDKENVIEEIGDIEFYLSGIRTKLYIARIDTLSHNINKLNTRYPQGYTDKSAQERKDKAQS